MLSLLLHEWRSYAFLKTYTNLVHSPYMEENAYVKRSFAIFCPSSSARPAVMYYPHCNMQNNECLVMGVFVYVRIWFTHQSSGVMSLTWRVAQRGEAACVTCFRQIAGV